MTSQANLPHSSLLLGRGPKKRLILRSLKIHRKLMKISTAIIFSLYLSERRGDLYKRKKNWELVALKKTININYKLKGLKF